ncbi:hypothetical protein JHK82_048410 [Glycine max]|nr:hypothetical protein JHK82_048410 [Glycine max]
MKTQHSTPVRASNPNVLVAHVSTKESYVEAAANVVVKDRSAVHVTTMGLYIVCGDSTQLVALGKVFEDDGTIHNVPYADDVVRVCVVTIYDADARVPFPTSKIQYAREASNTFIGWPTHLVKPISNDSNHNVRKPVRRVDECNAAAETDSLGELMKILYDVYQIPVELSWEGSQFGLPNIGAKFFITHADVEEIISGEWMNSSAGLAFSPHVITIGVGEDIVAKLLSLSQQRPRALCTMSGTGTVSLVTLRQPTSTNASVTFKGQFQILCLSASYLVAEDGGPLNRTGGISVLLSSPDGHVIGGGVVVLIAGSPVQIVMSFIPDLHNMAWVSVVAVLMSFTYSFIGLGLGIATVIIFQALGDIAFAYPYSILLLEIQDTLQSPPPENQTMQSSTCAVDALDMQLLKMIHQETS